MSTPPVRSAPRRVARSRTCRFSQPRHHVSRQSPQFAANPLSGAAGALEISTLEKQELATADGDQSPERIQDKEGKV